MHAHTVNTKWHRTQQPTTLALFTSGEIGCWPCVCPRSLAWRLACMPTLICPFFLPRLLPVHNQHLIVLLPLSVRPGVDEHRAVPNLCVLRRLVCVGLGCRSISHHVVVVPPLAILALHHRNPVVGASVAHDQRGDRTYRTDSRCPTGQGVGQGIGQSGHVLGHDAGQVV